MAETSNSPKIRVLYLTPLEYLVWSKLTESAGLVDDALSTFFSAASFVEEFSTEVPNTGENDIQRVIDGFVQNGLISFRGANTAKGPRAVYSIHCKPEEFEIVLMDEQRETLAVSAAYFALIRAAQTSDLHAARDGQFTARFEEWVRQKFSGMHAETVLRKLVGYDRERRQQGWGIFLPCPGDEQNFMLCVTGYERFTFVVPETQKIRTHEAPVIEDKLPRHSPEELQELPLERLDALRAAWLRARADTEPQLQAIEIVRRRKAEEERQRIAARIVALEEDQLRLERQAAGKAGEIAALRSKLGV